MAAPPVAQADVAAWFDATYREKGLAYLRPPRAYPIFVQLLGLEHEARAAGDVEQTLAGLEAARQRGVVASGVDLSQAAVDLARELQPDVDAQVGNAEELPFGAGVFDGVTCLGSLERFLDREQALREMVRVAKPTAKFCFLVRNADTLVWRFWREGLGRREVDGHQDAMTLASWRSLFARCGLEVLQVLPDQWPRQRWRQLLPGRRPRPGRAEPVARSWLPLRFCNELIFVLERARGAI